MTHPPPSPPRGMHSRPAFTILLLLLSCLCCVQRGHSVGRTYPVGPIYVLVNDTIDIICVIDLNPADGLNSSSLNWYTNKLVDQRYVRILNESAIQLTIPNAQPSVENYVCKLRLPNQTFNGISYNEVRVGYKPSHVQNFKCVSHNWTNMTCTFEKPPNKVDSKYSLEFRVDPRDQPYECALKAEYNRMYRCTLTTDSKGGIYRQTYPYYYFTLSASNPLGSFAEEMIINHYDSVIPGSPVDLNYNITNVAPNAVSLTWRTPLEMQSFPKDLIHSVSYMSVYDNGVWHQMPPYITEYHKDPIRYELTGLPYAYVEYDVRVRIRVRNASDTPEMWSGNAALIFTSGSRIPDAPPATDAGGFYVDDNNHVYVYWRELPKHDENGPHFQYLVESQPSVLDKPTCTKFMCKYFNVQHNRHQDLHFDISSSNAMGPSRNTSHVRVPSKFRRCAPPGEIRNILHNKNDPDRHYVFSWSPPPSSGHAGHIITSYTVFWCKARNESPNQCDGAFDFTRIDADTTSYTHATTDTLNFAVAANSNTSSSGMSWARCTAIANNDINKVTDAKPTVGSDTATFEWNTACIDESLSHGYIITYCLVRGERDNSNCSEPAQNVTIDGAANHNYTIQRLIPYHTYKAHIAAKSTERIGPLSDPVYFTTLEASPSPPRDLRVQMTNSSAATLQWDPPAQMNGVLNRYIIWFNSQKFDMPKVGSASDRVVHVLTGLSANTDYKVTIRACTGARQCSEPSNTVETRTEVGKPGVVRLQTNDQPGVIEWEEPLLPGGNLDYYELEVQQDGKPRGPVFVNGTRCTIVMALCHGTELGYAFRVRAVNVRYALHMKHQQRLPQSDDEITGHRTGVVSSALAPSERAQHSVCEEEDVELFQRILHYDQHANHYRGEWQVVKNQDCRTSNRVMFVVVMATLFALMVSTYLAATFACRKLKRMKDIDVRMPEGLQEIILENGGNGGGGGALKNGPGIGGGIGSGIGGGVIGSSLGGTNVLDIGRMTEPKSTAAAEKLFVTMTEQEESLLPLASDRSLSHSELDDGHSSGTHSQCEDSDGGGHDGSSGRTLLMGTTDFDKYLGFSGTSPMTSKFKFVPPTVPPMMPSETTASSGYVAAQIPTPAVATTNSNGYVTHESLAVVNQPSSTVAADSYDQQPQQQQPAPIDVVQPPAPTMPPMNVNGYLPWNAITAAALSAAAASASETAAQSPDSGEAKVGTAVASGVGAAAAVMAEKTGISGYVTHKQLSDFGQLIQ